MWVHVGPIYYSGALRQAIDNSVPSQIALHHVARFGCSEAGVTEVREWTGAARIKTRCSPAKLDTEKLKAAHIFLLSST